MNDTGQVNSVFDDIEAAPLRRKDLLPKWIRFFCWFVIIMGALTVISCFLLLFIMPPHAKVEDTERFQRLLLYLFVLTLIVMGFKIFTAISLLREKQWAVKLAMAEACIYFIICSFPIISELILSDSASTDYISTVAVSVQMILIVPYFIKLYQIKDVWRRSTDTKQIGEISNTQ